MATHEIIQHISAYSSGTDLKSDPRTQELLRKGTNQRPIDPPLQEASPISSSRYEVYPKLQQK